MNTTHEAIGTYYPATPGATTLKDSSDLYINGQRVSAMVDEDGGYSVFVGTKIVAYGELNGTEGELMMFFAAKALVATTEVETETISETVKNIRSEADVLHVEADALDVTTPLIDRRGRVVPVTAPWHNAYRAAILRSNAAILAAWTDADESGYKQYISDGLADTDGYYTPIDRASWKATTSA